MTLETPSQHSGRTPKPGTKSSRLLAVLDLFSVEAPVWTVETMAGPLGVAPATAYRYVRDLCEAGLLIQAAGGGYALGPRFIEIDRQIRIADPLLKIGPRIMESLRDRQVGAQLLCSFYGTRVLCIHQDRSDDRISMSMERGRPFPLFLGAPSRIILANLPSYHLKSLFLSHSREIERAGLGAGWHEFKERLKSIRKRGIYVGSEIDAELVGVAAPIFRAPATVVASLCMVRLRAEATGDVLTVLEAKARLGAEAISTKLQASGTPVTAPSYASARQPR
ncbi:IclR family transcriptional regulator C-terminal domain-containing protein [Mesorhizobium sp. KR9-304]|uniref:IclR family transcriptional regulator n=1 Tax=Mesorhizobium sp. KR9-304 TaxID=3156614 RepID=UPI0032B44B31